MSQNSHSLTLFFSNRIQQLQCDLLFKALNNGNHDEIRRWSDKLGVSLEQEWDGDWFNVAYTVADSHIQLHYDTSKHYHLPLEPLSRLFKAGLKAAVLQVFYSQVGERERYHFLDDAMVGRRHWQQKVPELVPMLATTDDPDDRISDIGDDKPQPLATLILEHQRENEEAMQAVRTLVGDGSSPGALVKGWKILKAAGRGVAHAAVFTLIALLAFKGSKLMWMGVGALLAVLLPLAYTYWESRKWSQADTMSDHANDQQDAPPSGGNALPQSGQKYQAVALERVGPRLTDAETAAIRGICQRVLADERADVKQYLIAFAKISISLTRLDKKYHGDDAQLTEDDAKEFSDLYAQQKVFLRSEKMHGYFCQYYRNVLGQIQSETLLGTMIQQFSEACDLSGVLIGMLENKETAATFAAAVNSMDDFLNWKDYLLKMTETEEEASPVAAKPDRGMFKTKLLIAGLFVLMAGALGNEELAGYRRDSAIQQDPQVVAATIVGHDVESSKRRGRTTDKYNVHYAFEAGGKRYTDVVTLKNETGAQAVEHGSLEVVYSKSNPALHVMKSSYHDGRTTGGLLKSMLFALLFSLVGAVLGGGLMAWKFGWLKKAD